MGNNIQNRSTKSATTQSQFFDDIKQQQFTNQLCSIQNPQYAEKYQQFQKFTKVNCKLHGSPIQFICLFDNCKNGIGCCKRQQCRAQHKHLSNYFLMKKSIFDLKYNQRSLMFKNYRAQLEMKVGKIYEDVIKNLDDMIKYLKKDSQDIYSLYKYCLNYQDTNQLIFQGQFQNVQRLELKKFLNFQPIKICETKFQTINKKLDQRYSQFKKDYLTTIHLQTKKFKLQQSRRISQQKQTIDIENNHIRISETKWDKVYKTMSELDQKPKFLLISCNMQYFDVNQNNLDLRKFCDVLKDDRNNNLKILKMYTNWHIYQQNQYDYFSNQLGRIKNLAKVIIITRQPIKSLSSFKKISNKINIQSEDWTEKTMNMKFIQ